MKLGASKLLACMIIIAAIAATAGCSYIKTNQKARDALRGDVSKAALAAEMPQVTDGRTWQEGTWQAPNYNVHVFAPQITEQLRADLLKAGLFTSLTPPEGPAAEAAPYRLEVTVEAFALTDQGNNAWRVPQVIVNGALLPAFALTNVVTQGQADMAGYVMPSTNLGTDLRAQFKLIDKESGVMVLKRSYQSTLPLGSVSQADLFSGQENGDYGVATGVAKGNEAIADLSDLCVRDPAWSFVDEYKGLALAEKAVSESDTPQATRCETALLMLAMLQPLKYTNSEVKILHDDTIDAGVRASLFNETRARTLGYDNPEALPEGQRIDSEQAAKLLDDTSLLNEVVIADLDSRIIQAAVDAIIPPKAKSAAKEESTGQDTAKPAGAPAIQGKPQGPSPSGNGPMAAEQDNQAAPQEAAEAQAQPDQQAPAVDPQDLERMQAAVAEALVACLQNKPVMQNLLTAIADEMVGDQWAPMKKLLEQMNSPVTAAYLKKRG